MQKIGVTSNVILPRGRTAMTESMPHAHMFAAPKQGFDVFNPANVARILPAPEWMLLVWLAGGALAMIGGFVYAELGSRLPLFFSLVIGISFLLLVVVFRSLMIPLKAALMNLLSIGAAYGVVVPVFQGGWGGNLVGGGSPGPIEAWGDVTREQGRQEPAIDGRRTAQHAQPPGADHQDVLGKHRQQGRGTTQQHGEQVQRHGAQQHLAMPDKTQAGEQG